VEDILSRIAEIKRSGEKAAFCIIVETKGSSPRKAGSKMIVFENGSTEGTIGGGSLEMKAIEDAMKVISENKPMKFAYELEDDLSMHCGGTAEVYIEPLVPILKLMIFGAGHIGKALIKYAPDFGFNITLIDHRKELLDNFDSEKIELINEKYLKAAERLVSDQNTCIVIVTPKHVFDEEVLALFAKKPFAYLGMIGSKTKIALARKRLIEEKKLTEKELDRVDMPIGIKFNAQTPEEIAISILAKLIDIKNSKGTA
jgi:xanthine dehydrogenase accessory factor